MIIGIALRYIKTYSGINYIPITNGENFSGFVGNNGVGKSSILEAFDCYFNNKPWNLNVATKKSGLTVTTPYIVPIFLVKKADFDVDLLELAEKLSDVIWEIEESDIASINRTHLKTFIDQREKIKSKIKREDYLIIPVGIDINGNISVSIFNSTKLSKAIFDDETEEDESQLLTTEQLNQLLGIYAFLKVKYQYIYIPKDIDPSSFTKLETIEIQALMGQSLNEILEECVSQSQISAINKNLNDFLNKLSEELESYSFRTPTDRQQNLKKNDIYKLIIEAFFTIRKLHKRQGEHWLEISSLSSGEKQKAIIEVTHNLIKNHRESNENLIIAVDEPESSLHMSACFEHFLKMYEISKNVHQFFFSTHWYGFLPIIETGSVTAISYDVTIHRFDLISLTNYRELVKQQIKSSEGKLPFDIRLKSLNDFIQSIVSSILENEPFNWLICEGSSEKIYFDYYFNDLVQGKKLRIIPVGGANEIKRIYELLIVSIEEFKKSLRGKIVFISDTDTDLVQYDTSQNRNIFNKRIVNQDGDTKLVNISANPKSPNTEIEDALNGKAFYNTLLKFKPDNPIELDFLSDGSNPTEMASGISLDLRISEKKKLTDFFDKNDHKIRFANQYIEEVKANGAYKIPEWIKEIKQFIGA